MNFPKRILEVLALLLLLTLTWAIDVYHIGVFPPPELASGDGAGGRAQWIPRSESGNLNHLILSGTPFERGLRAGRLTAPLLQLQESILVSQLHTFFPNPLLLRGFLVVLTRWFWGSEHYFEPWMIEEMFGVSKSSPNEFNRLSDPLTRQVAYHGLHEVGQLMVDQGSEDMGCTVVAVPYRSAWVIGRNFDFEGGRIFDTEKIVKWVFPDHGYPFVSIIWAGMVGAVTGVNSEGVYISLNAAGSTDVRRHGTPSTLVLLKALQFSKTAEEAVEAIRRETMFITDIFVVADRSTGKAFKIEKSPRNTEVIPLKAPSIVTNHLSAARWKNDSINIYRQQELTSQARQLRGEHLLVEFGANHPPDSRAWTENVLRILRDKGEKDGNPLHLGNRKAIDSLIATHSVIYNGPDQILYVSHGPGVSGSFSGFDLKASFEKKTPVVAHTLPRDPDVSDDLFTRIHLASHEISQAERLIARRKCREAEALLHTASSRFSQTYMYFSALGLFRSQCSGDPKSARLSWRRALDLVPSYPRDVRRLENLLKTGENE